MFPAGGRRFLLWFGSGAALRSRLAGLFTACCAAALVATVTVVASATVAVAILPALITLLARVALIAALVAAGAAALRRQSRARALNFLGRALEAAQLLAQGFNFAFVCGGLAFSFLEQFENLIELIERFAQCGDHAHHVIDGTANGRGKRRLGRWNGARRRWWWLGRTFIAHPAIVTGRAILPALPVIARTFPFVTIPGGAFLAVARWLRLTSRVALSQAQFDVVRLGRCSRGGLGRRFVRLRFRVRRGGEKTFFIRALDFVLFLGVSGVFGRSLVVGCFHVGRLGLEGGIVGCFVGVILGSGCAGGGVTVGNGAKAAASTTAATATAGAAATGGGGTLGRRAGRR